MIKISNLSISYNNQTVVENVNLKVKKGKITALIGLSGSGKTTILYRLGLINEDMTFDYEWEGKNLNKLSHTQRDKLAATQIGYVLQTKNIVEKTVYRNVEYAFKLENRKVNREEILKALKKVNLENEIDQEVAQLSEGQKQRLAILCAMLKRPRLLILDEPTSALDYENAIQIMKLLKTLTNQGVTILFSTHQLELLEYADVVYMIEGQSIVLKKDVDEEIKETEKYKEKIDKKYTLNSLLYFTKSFFKRYFYKDLLIILLYSVILFMGIFSISYHDLIKNDAMKQIYGNYNPNQIYVMTDDYVYEQLMNDRRVQAVYPYYALKATIGSTSFDILPIYSENDFDDYYILNSLILEEEGNFSSYDAYNGLSYNGGKNVLLKFTFDYVNFLPQTIDIDGCLDQSVGNLYSTNSQFIYMPIEEIKKIVESLDKSDFVNGYTLFLKEYSQKNSILSDYHIDTYKEATYENTVIKELIETFEEYKQNIIVIVGMFIFIILLLTLYNYLKQRKQEFSVMLINGLKKENLFTILVYENLSCVVFSGIVGMGIFYLSSFILLKFGYNIIPNGFVFIGKLLILLSFLLFISNQILNAVFLQFLNKEKALRN